MRRAVHPLLRPLFLAAFAGAAFGGASVWLNVSGPRGVAAFVGSGAGWALFAVACGAMARSPRLTAALVATVALLVAVTTYYVADSIPADGPVRLVDVGEWQLWSVAALVLGPPLGVAGALLRSLCAFRLAHRSM